MLAKRQINSSIICQFLSDFNKKMIYIHKIITNCYLKFDQVEGDPVKPNNRKQKRKIKPKNRQST